MGFHLKLRLPQEIVVRCPRANSPSDTCIRTPGWSVCGQWVRACHQSGLCASCRYALQGWPPSTSTLCSRISGRDDNVDSLLKTIRNSVLEFNGSLEEVLPESRELARQRIRSPVSLCTHSRGRCFATSTVSSVSCGMGTSMVSSHDGLRSW